MPNHRPLTADEIAEVVADPRLIHTYYAERIVATIVKYREALVKAKVALGDEE